MVLRRNLQLPVRPPRRVPLELGLSSGGFGITAGRTWFQAGAIVFGEPSPYRQLVEVDTTNWTGREDVEGQPEVIEPDTFTRILLSNVDCGAIVDAHGANAEYPAWRTVDPSAVSHVRGGTVTLGGFQNPQAGRLAIEANAKVLDDGFRQVLRKLMALRERKVPGWQATSELRLFAFHSANGSIGPNVFALIEALRRHIDPIFPNTSTFLMTGLLAEGRVPDRTRAAAIQRAFLTECRVRCGEE